MNITPEQKRTLLQELAEAMIVPGLDTLDPDTEITVPDLAKATGTTYHTATDFLTRNGYRRTRQVRNDKGMTVWVWAK